MEGEGDQIKSRRGTQISNPIGIYLHSIVFLEELKTCSEISRPLEAVCINAFMRFLLYVCTSILYFISRPLTDIVKTTRIDPNLFVFFAKNVDQDMVGSTWEVKIINLHI